MNEEDQYCFFKGWSVPGTVKQTHCKWLEFRFGYIAMYHTEGNELCGFFCTYGGNLTNRLGDSQYSCRKCSHYECVKGSIPERKVNI